MKATEWMRMLETVAHRPPDEANAEWEWLLEELGLGPEYFLAIYEAVRQGRWRTARDPKAYLKTVAKREAAEMELPAQGDARLVFPGEIECEGEEITQEERLDYMQHQYDSAGPSQAADGVWRPGPERRQRRGNYFAELMTRVPGELKVVEQPTEDMVEAIERLNEIRDNVYIRLESSIRANWAAWAEAARLDEWEQEVLRCKLNLVGRRKALDRQRDERSRRALQAAWRKFDRTGAQRLRRAAKKILKKMSPDRRLWTLVGRVDLY